MRGNSFGCNWWLYGLVLNKTREEKTRCECEQRYPDVLPDLHCVFPQSTIYVAHLMWPSARRLTNSKAPLVLDCSGALGGLDDSKRLSCISLLREV